MDEQEQIEMSLARSQADVQAVKEELDRATETIRILQTSHTRVVHLLRNAERDLITQQNNHRLYMVRQAIMRRHLTAIYETQAQQLQKENEEFHAAVVEARDAWHDLRIGYDNLKEHLALLQRERFNPDFIDDDARDLGEQQGQPALSKESKSTHLHGVEL